MPPRPHIMTFRQLEESRAALDSDVQVVSRSEVSRPLLNGASVDCRSGDAACLTPKGRALIFSIVVVEAIVFLAIAITSLQGPADLSHSAWVLATLSLLFLALSQLRRWVTRRLLED
ncbi:hypothetical protein [Singulisphaera acidiphila]|uniref:Uncharacterized protein n=1 Tax=Singulisphaera acidiphila (strain ATCC BAA-1392 / DSM 18658 / VKM B-2454 / MOB10) TaxID=886293 RepID=L0DHK9_SINAD|nr:hypothetical protein [Singulisphaera acidiphila]AGA28171.1 hypothetical protein Sinac_3943 [Singulisphaera acidiphila DSM 18658]